MKRWTIRIFAFLLLGAIVNVAVALSIPPFSSGVVQQYGWPIPAIGDEFGNGPRQPIWPGFAINTVFYAAVLWVLCAAPFVLRRWRRIRRGLCPKCGYDLRNRPNDSAVCPECGQSQTVS
jgi:hypothetical protein